MLLRLPAFWTPILDVDESQFAGYANALIDGGTPFIASVDTKPIGIYYYFAIVFLIFGKNNMLAVHVITAIWVWLTAMYCYKIAKTIYTKQAGWFAAVFYAVFTTTYIPKFISTSIMIVLMLPLTISIYYMVRWERTRNYGSLFVAGIFFGLACLFKYQAGINLVLAAAYFIVLAPLYLKDKTRPKLKPFLIFAIGGVLIGFVFLAYLKFSGLWNDFYFWSIVGSVTYIDAGIQTSDFFRRLFMRGGFFVISSFLIWFFAGKQILYLVRSARNKVFPKTPETCLVASWLFISFIPVCAGGRFFGHYFIQLIPALSILAACSVARTIVSRPWNAKRTQQIWTAIVLAMAIPAVSFFTARLYAGDIYKAIGEDDPEAYRPLGEYIKKRTSPDDRIFVWGFATPVYFFAERMQASRFLWCDWLTGRISGSPTARDESFDTSSYSTKGSWKMLFEDLDKNKPVYIVDTSPGNYHDYGKYPIDNYQSLVRYLDKYYGLEAKYKGAHFYRRKEEER